MSCEIIEKTDIAPTVSRHVIRAPLVAVKAKAGQFVILRAHEGGERIPITISDWDAASGTITLFIQSAGKTTSVFNAMKAGESFQNVLGPLGVPVEEKNYGTVVCVGGGVGIAEVYPIARALKKAGNRVLAALGARSKDLLILSDEMRAVSDAVEIRTDDGSLGERGLVTGALSVFHSREKIDAAFIIGPIPMMKAVSELCRSWKLPAFASLNPIMLDGTGMCGCCRVEVGGVTKFACVDGPLFDAALVNFESLSARSSAYRPAELAQLERHRCKLG